MIERETPIMDGKANNGLEIGENKINKTNIGETDRLTGTTSVLVPTPVESLPPIASETHTPLTRAELVERAQQAKPIGPEDKRYNEVVDNSILTALGEEGSVTKNSTQEELDNIATAAKEQAIKEYGTPSPVIGKEVVREISPSVTGEETNLPKSASTNAFETFLKEGRIGEDLIVLRELNINGQRALEYQDPATGQKATLLEGGRLNAENVMHITPPVEFNNPDAVLDWINERLYVYETRVDEFDQSDIHYIEQTINQECFTDVPDTRNPIASPAQIAFFQSEVNRLNRTKRPGEPDTTFEELRDAYRNALIDQVKMRSKLQSAKFRVSYNIKDAAAIASSLSNSEAEIFHITEIKLRSGRKIDNPFKVKGLDEALAAMEDDYGRYFRSDAAAKPATAASPAVPSLKEQLKTRLSDPRLGLSPREIEVAIDLGEKEMLLYGESSYYDGIVLDVNARDPAKRAKVHEFIDEVDLKLPEYNRGVDRRNIERAARNTAAGLVPGDANYEQHEDHVGWSKDFFVSEEILRVYYNAPAVRKPRNEEELDNSVYLEELISRCMREKFDLFDFGDETGSGGSLGGSGPRNGKRSFYWGVFLNKAGGEADKEKGQAAWLRRIATAWVTSSIRRASVDSPASIKFTDVVNNYLKPDRKISEFTSKLTTWGSILAAQGESRDQFVKDPEKSILNTPLKSPERLTAEVINGPAEIRHKTIAEVYENLTEINNVASAGLRIAAKKKAFCNLLDGVLTYQENNDLHYADGFPYSRPDGKTKLAVIEHFLHERKITYAQAHDLIHAHIGSALRTHLPHSGLRLGQEIAEHILGRFFRLVFKDFKP